MKTLKQQFVDTCTYDPVKGELCFNTKIKPLLKKWLEQKRQQEIHFYEENKHWNPSYAIFDIFFEELDHK